MPEFYSKSFLLPAGRTYALGADGTSSITGPLFPLGASALPAINAIMPKAGSGATVNIGLFNGGQFIQTVHLNGGEIYPFRPSILGVPAGDVIGLV